MSKTYKVAGMTCGGCAKSVSAALSKAAPDAEFAVDHAAGLVSVKGEVAADTVKQVVENAGFDFLGEAA
ncbi:MAG TPA: heavy-metal-associated domain-containing protein [Azospirillaceae bacterium]|nr:heavy-metal-associated domain-containing protein [Azospirillaceae bacterium]